MKILAERLRAGYAGIILVTQEEARATALVGRVARDIEFKVYHWTATHTAVFDADENKEFKPTPNGAADALQSVHAMSESSVLIMQDMHLLLADPNPWLYRLVKDVLAAARSRLISLVWIMPEWRLPLDLEKQFNVIPFELPSREDLARQLDLLCHEPDGAGGLHRTSPTPQGEELEAILDAGAGLTCAEFEDAAALSLLTTSRFLPEIIIREKISTIRKNGLVEYIEPRLTLDDLGGWDAYKEELMLARHQFSRAAREFRLEPLKGDLLVGQGGNGKSLASTIVSGIFGVPGLAVHADALKGSLVGQTEGNWRKVMDTARAISGNGDGGCVLFIDEIDGLTSGHKSSGQTDGGTTANLIKALLKDIQNSRGIYFLFTANDLDNIPDPLVDRLNVWSVDLPNEDERQEIWSIHIRRRGRKPQTFDLKKLAAASEGFSGRQIERVWLKAMSLAFADSRREPTTQDCLTKLAAETPTSVTMKEAIEARRARLKGRARPVTKEKAGPSPSAPSGRKVARLN